MKNLSSSDFDIDGQPMPSNTQPQNGTPASGETRANHSSLVGSQSADNMHAAKSPQKNFPQTTSWLGAESPWVAAGLSAVTGLILGVMLGRRE